MPCLLHSARAGFQARHASWFFFALFSVILSVLPPATQALPRAFLTCDALADALNNSVTHNLSPAVRAFCRVTTGAFESFYGEEKDAELAVVVVDGEEVAASDLWDYESTHILRCCVAF